MGYESFQQQHPVLLSRIAGYWRDPKNETANLTLGYEFALYAGEGDTPQDGYEAMEALKRSFVIKASSEQIAALRVHIANAHDLRGINPQCMDYARRMEALHVLLHDQIMPGEPYPDEWHKWRRVCEPLMWFAAIGKFAAF